MVEREGIENCVVTWRTLMLCVTSLIKTPCLKPQLNNQLWAFNFGLVGVRSISLSTLSTPDKPLSVILFGFLNPFTLFNDNRCLKDVLKKKKREPVIQKWLPHIDGQRPHVVLAKDGQHPRVGLPLAVRFLQLVHFLPLQLAWHVPQRLPAIRIKKKTFWFD